METHMKSLPAVFALASALMASACATVPPPTDLMAAAEQSVQRANAARGEDPSPPELRAARAKLAGAQDAIAKRELLTATRLAEEARLDADLATARIESARAQFEVEAMKKGNEALQQQALRNSVNVSPIAIPAPISDAAGDPAETPYNPPPVAPQ